VPDISYQDVKRAFDEAERDIRYAELSINDLSIGSTSSDGLNDSAIPCKSSCPVFEGPRCGVVVPAINELRYAGKHLTNAISFQAAGKKGEEQEQLCRAKRHCLRARYDALRATALFLIRDYQQFTADYRTISQHVKGESEHRKVVEGTLGFLCRDKSDEPDEDTDKACEELHGAVEKLKEVYRHCSEQRGMLNTVLAVIEAQREQIRDLLVEQGKSGIKVTIKWAIIALIYTTILSIVFLILGSYISSN